MFNSLYKFSSFSVLFLITKFVSTDPICTTPNNEEAKCVRINSCAPIYNVFVRAEKEKVKISKSRRLFIQSSLCSFDQDATPVVCCGKESDFKDSFKIPADYAYPSETKCGVSKFFTTSSDNSQTNLGEFPWTAYIQYSKITSQTTPKYSCSGTLISNRYILTAAHCVLGEVQDILGNVSAVALGVWNIDSNVDCITAKACNRPNIVKIEEVITHENFSTARGGKHHPNDIALLRLQTPIVFYDFVQPICLPTQNSWDDKSFLYVLTWGYNKRAEVPNHFIQIKLKTKKIGNPQCRWIYEKNYRIRITQNQLCAEGNNEINTCYGDGGGGLINNFNGKWYLQGIVSFGPTVCETPGVPNIYTKVLDYVHWIKKK